MIYSRIDVYNTMETTGMVPLFYHDDVEVAIKVIKACYEGGARLLEFTNRGVFAHEVFAELSKYCIKQLPGMILGVGSVTDAGTAALYMQLGASFVVTPSLREDIALICNRRKVMWSPGCGSLTEIGRAEELGCEVVKLFPGSTYGPEFVKAITGPQPWTKVMPTGGVSPTEDNLKGWFNAGVHCVGMGSQLLSKELINSGNWDAIKHKTKVAIQLIQTIKNK